MPRFILAAGRGGAFFPPNPPPPPPPPPPPLPAYLAGAHTNGTPYLHLFTSDDGLSWTHDPTTSIYPTTTYRDPGLRIDADEVWWIIANGDGAVDRNALLSSPDGVAWTHIASPSLASLSPTNTWAPTWFVDTDDSVHIITCAKVAGGFKLYELHPTNEAMTTWSAPVQITGTGFPTNAIDPFIQYWSGVYYLLYKNDGTGSICLATSSSPFSGYTTIKTGDWAGWKASPSKSSIEGPILVDIGTGWRIYFTHNSGFNAVHMYYSETTDRTMVTGWSTATSLPTLDGYNHAMPIAT